MVEHRVEKLQGDGRKSNRKRGCRAEAFRFCRFGMGDALRIQKGELLISGDLRACLRDQRRYPGVRVAPITGALALESTTLPEWTRKSDKRPHKDPSDRFIVAEARRRNAVLITCDALMIDYARRGNVVVFDARM